MYNFIVQLMTNLRLSTFFEAYDAQDTESMRQWAQECLKANPQMVVEVFCACVQDPDEVVAVDFMLDQISTAQQWALATHLFAEKKGEYFDYLLPKLSDEHSHFSFCCVEYILIEAVNTQNIPLLQSIIPHLKKSFHCDWEEAYTPQEVNGAWETALDKAVEKGWFEVVKTLLPHTSEEARFIPALTAVEWQRKDYLAYIFTQSSLDLSIGVALHTIGMPKCRKMARHILNSYPQIVSDERFLLSVHNWDDNAKKQWVANYISQKQHSKISSSLSQRATKTTASVRKM